MRGSARAWEPWVLAGLAASSVAVALLATQRFGIGLTPDSAVFLEVGERLVREGRMEMAHGEPFVTGPPAYPALAGLLSRLSGGPSGRLEALRLAHALLWGLHVWLCATWWRKHAPGAGWWIAGGAILLVSVPAWSVFCYAWTESLFLVLVAAWLIVSTPLAETGGARGFWPAALVAALATMTRYTGVSLIGAGCLAILTASNGRWAARIRRAAGFAAASSVPLALWLARNRALSGTWTGERGASTHGAAENLRAMSHAVGGWLGIDGLPSIVSAPIAAALAAAVAACLATALFRASFRRAGAPPAARGALLAASATALCYLAFIVASATSIGFDALDDRLLSPALVPSLSVALLSLAIVLAPAGPSGGGRAAAARRMLAVVVLVWISGSGIRTARAVRSAMANGVGGFSVASWQRSGLLEAVRRLPLDATVLSNSPGAVYLLAGRPAALAPRRTHYASREPVGRDLEALVARLAAGPTLYLAWFDSPVEPHLHEPEQLAAVARVDLVSRAEDGRLFRLSARAEGPNPEAALPAASAR